MSRASTVVGYLTTLALRQTHHLDRLSSDAGTDSVFARLTDLRNAVAVRAQTSEAVRRLEQDIAGGSVEGRTQARLQLALEDALEHDSTFDRQITDLLNQIKAEDARRGTSLLRDAARALRGQPGLAGSVHTQRGYTSWGTPLTLAAAGGTCVVVIVVGGGTVILGRGGDGDTPEPRAAGTSAPPSAVAASPAATQTTFGQATIFETAAGFRYSLQASALSWRSEIPGDTAGPGQGFVTVTVRETNLLTDRTAPDPLADESALPGLIFPETSDSATGSGCPAGIPVLDLSARGRPVGHCFDGLVPAEQTGAIAPGASQDVVLTNQTGLATSRQLSELELWAEISGSSRFQRLTPPS